MKKHFGLSLALLLGTSLGAIASNGDSYDYVSPFIPLLDYSIHQNSKPAGVDSAGCSIYVDRVVTNVASDLKALRNSRELNVNWTTEIPNREVLYSTILSSENGRISKKSSSVQAQTITYLNLINSHRSANRFAEKLLSDGTGERTENESQAAKRLVKFINVNCFQ